MLSDRPFSTARVKTSVTDALSVSPLPNDTTGVSAMLNVSVKLTPNVLNISILSVIPTESASVLLRSYASSSLTKVASSALLSRL